MQILSAGVLLQRCTPEHQQKVDWTLSAARGIRAQASADARAGRIEQAKKLAADADNFQLIAENILLRHVSVPDLGIPRLPPGVSLNLPHGGRIS